MTSPGTPVLTLLTFKAVDEADWVHNNVTKEKVADIRRSRFTARL
jgi:hypothetical protein